jgi:NAD(P)-dependent dehydrogenase (short-subunit alcohol dehydrogenase family)
MNYRDRHVVVTGGTGALGTAVVGALLEAGAVCHVPYRSEDEAQRFPHRGHKSVTLVALGDLADEAVVSAFYGGIAKLWESIHIAGGFAFAPIEKSDMARLMGQIEATSSRPVCAAARRSALSARPASGGHRQRSGPPEALAPV